MIYLGIDPGLDGGIAFLEEDGRLLLTKPPTIGGKEYDIQGMKQILEPLRYPAKVIATIENQISMPGQGLTSTLQTGKGFGIWLGLLAGMNIPYQVVAARQWQVKLFTGVKATLDTKEKSEIIAKRLFPTTDFRKSDRAFKANDGLTDAACIAEFGRRTHTQKAPEPVSGIPHRFHPKNPDVCIGCGAFRPSENDCKQQAIPMPQL